jgi:hypothetical protein
MAVEAFSSQFTPDAAGFVYRRNGKGAGHRISAAERDAFVARFRTQFRMVFSTMLLAALLTTPLTLRLAAKSPYLAVLPGLSILGVALLALARIWGGPGRALAGRGDAG